MRYFCFTFAFGKPYPWYWKPDFTRDFQNKGNVHFTVYRMKIFCFRFDLALHYKS